MKTAIMSTAIILTICICVGAGYYLIDNARIFFGVTFLICANNLNNAIPSIVVGIIRGKNL